MSKQWFIFFRDRHLGPFSREEVLLRLKSKKIDLQTTVWRQGMDQWCELRHCKEFFPPTPAVPKSKPLPSPSKTVPPIPKAPSVAKDIPSIPKAEAKVVPSIPKAEVKAPEIIPGPSLPPLPSEPILEVPFQEVAPPIDFIDVPPPPTELPPLPDVSLEIEETFEVDPVYEEELEEDDVLESEQVELPDLPLLSRPSRKLLYWKIFLGLIPAVVVLLWGILLIAPRPVELPAGQLAAGSIKQLESVITNKQDAVAISVVVSSDRKKLILASNFAGPAELYLSLTSYRGKILSNTQSILTASATLDGHLAVFSDLRIDEGEGLVPGLYMVQVRGVKSDPWTRFLKFMRTVQPFRSIAFFRDLNDRFNYRGDLLFGVDRSEQLEEKLKQFKLQQKAELSKPLLELLERYRTYSSIVEMLNHLFRSSLKRFREPGAIHLFEKDYVQKIAPLYQSITIENQKIQVSLIESDEELSQEYQKLVEYGRQIGQLVVEINERLKKYRKLKSKNRLELLLLFQGKLNELEELGKMRIHKLQQGLSDI